MTLDRDRLLAVGWIALCAGALLAPALDTAHIVGYRILCHNVTSGWGANRTNLCAGALGESIISVGGVVVWLSVLVAAFGSLACGIAARRALPDRRAAARRLIASSVVYAASVFAEFIRLGIAGVTPLAAMPFASIIPAGILLVWLVLLGVVTLVYRAWVRRLRRPRRGIPLPPSPPRSTME